MTDITALPPQSSIVDTTSMVTSEAKLLMYATLRNQLITDAISDNLTIPSTSKSLSQVGTQSLLAGKLNAGSNLADLSDLAAALTNLGIVPASTTAKGIIETATDAETLATSDTTKAVTPSNLAAVLGMKFVCTLTASSSIFLSATLSNKKIYFFEFVSLIPTNNGAGICAQVSTDGGLTWLNSNYLSGNYQASTSDPLNTITNNTTRWSIAGFDSDGNRSQTNISSYGGMNGSFIIYDPANAGINKMAQWRTLYREVSPYFYVNDVTGYGSYNGSTSAINAIRFIYKASNSDTNNGNIASGYINMYESIT